MENTNKIEIHYKRAKFGHRILAIILDFVFFVCSFFILFISTRAIVASTSEYQKNLNAMNTVKTDCGLFEEADGQIIDIITYYNAFDLDDNQKIFKSKMAIMKFCDYMEINAEEPSVYEALIRDIKNAATKDIVSKIGVPYFVFDDDGKVVRNPDTDLISFSTIFKEFYTPVVDNICNSYLVTGVPHYHDYMNFMSVQLFFIEIPISYLLSGILIYFVPTLIFRKGRKTFGKAIYHIGVVDKRLLNPTFNRSLARFAIFYFAELILTLFTLGIPLIISFSMMIFTKNKQNFHDYMLGLIEVDTSDNKIFDNYDEITLNELNHCKKPVDFKMERTL